MMLPGDWGSVVLYVDGFDRAVLFGCFATSCKITGLRVVGLGLSIVFQMKYGGANLLAGTASDTGVFINPDMHERTSILVR